MHHTFDAHCGGQIEFLTYVWQAMHNPISATTFAYIESLEPAVRSAAASAVSEGNPSGLSLSLQQVIDLAKSIKVVAATDGFSRDELGALEFMMIMASIPHEVQQHVVDFDVSELSVEHVGELFTSSSRLASYVLSAATTVAAFDGLSDLELGQARALADRLQIPPRVSEALIAHGWALGLAMQRGDSAVVRSLLSAREAMLGWAETPQK